VTASVLDRVAALLTAERGDPATYETPGELARSIDQRIIQTPALEILDEALVAAGNHAHPRLIFTMPPQEGKSERVSRAFPLWLLLRNPNLRVGVVSYADRLARRSGRQVRNDIAANPDLGLLVQYGSRAANEWTLDGAAGGMITSGIGGGLTGRPIDVLIIDDPMKDRADAESETIRENAWDWWTDVGSARLGPNSIVVLIMTRWHEDDLAGRLLADAPDVWRHINIPAQADHDPELGQVDVLGRQVGEFMLSARGRTVTEWTERKRAAGSRAWAALYQGRPAPAEGGILKRAWFQFYDQPRAVRRDDGTWFAAGADQVWITVDAAFKDTKASDFVCMQVWAYSGAKAWLLDQVLDRMDFPATCDALLSLSAKWPQATGKLIEDKANGPAVLSMMADKIAGMVPETPKDSKEARAHAIAPLLEAGSVEFPSPTFAPWVVGLVDEATAFPNAAHDDQVDAMTQILRRLFLGPRPRVRTLGVPLRR